MKKAANNNNKLSSLDDLDDMLDDGPIILNQKKQKEPLKVSAP